MVSIKHIEHNLVMLNQLYMGSINHSFIVTAELLSQSV